MFHIILYKKLKKLYQLTKKISNKNTYRLDFNIRFQAKTHTYSDFNIRFQAKTQTNFKQKHIQISGTQELASITHHISQHLQV